MQATWEILKQGLQFVGDKFQWLWDNIVQPVWNFIKSATQAAWDFMSPVFDAIKTGIGFVADAFDLAKKAIEIAWNAIQEVAKAPVRFIVNTVYDENIRPLFNTVAEKLGVEFRLPEKRVNFATGGFVSGPGGPTADMVPAMLSAGEFVIPAQRVRDLGVGFFEAVRSGVFPSSRFAEGGPVDVIDIVAGASPFAAVDKAAQKGWNALIDMFANAAKSALGLLPATGGAFRDALKAGGDTAIDWMVEKLKFASTASLEGFQPGAGVAQWRPQVEQVLRMLNEPLSLVPNVLRRMQQESGGNPRAVNLWDSNAVAGTPSVGLMQVIRPTYQTYKGPDNPPHMHGVSIDPISNIYAGLNYARNRYPSIQFAMDKPGGYRHGGPVQVFDHGGVVDPGLFMGINGTGGREVLLNAADIQPRGDINFAPQITVHGSMTREVEDKLMDDLTELARNIKTKTGGRI
ncbi:hypothetical protein GCM10012275_28200 [Longimycelium tulufanense]|uniref:Transglycosylase SLT domain-containing protein n=1 Tax=Longimycelium tulufanense TaxID=907463 RepID=A0A8J3CBP3_9PSEU|nr:transglycosylase SLT domain-containing protein [Longimycelium tulufanense]GGM55435.1 hypothetical protein GCM10012275_28200 [Longimycelium tulufanense]